MEVVLRDVLTVVAEFIAVVTVEVVLLVVFIVVVESVLVVTVEVVLLVVFIVVVELSSGAASEGGAARCIHRSC